MMPAYTTQRFDNVNFQFLCSDSDAEELSGIVVLRPGEMVLEIHGGNGPYLIKGASQEHWFEGVNTERQPSSKVLAKWAYTGERWVGTWVEGGHEFLFSFQLSRQK